MRSVEKVFAVYRNIVRGIAAAVLLALLIAALRGIGAQGAVDRLRKMLFYTDPAYTRSEKEERTPSEGPPAAAAEREATETSDRQGGETPPETEDELYMLFAMLT